MKLADLKPDKKNARRRTPRNLAMIEAALTEVGAARSIVIDEDGTVLAGNGTLQAAKTVGLDRVQVVDVDGDTLVAVRRTGLTKEQKVRLALYDNRAAELAEWDSVQLSELADEFAIDDLISTEELDAIIEADNGGAAAMAPPEDVEPQISRADELQAQWGTATGQLWRLGKHRLICGDSADQATIARVRNDGPIQIIVTDPPYGMRLDTAYSGMQGNSTRAIEFQRSKHTPQGRDYLPVIGDNADYDPSPIMALLADIKEQFWFGADYYAERITDKNKGSWLVWDKRANDTDDPHTAVFDRMYGSQFELCWSKAAHKREIIRVRFAGVFGTETQDTRSRIHPTQKPMQVIEWILQRYSTEGAICLDLYAGSGTTLIACERLSRQCRAVELDPGYCAVILQRYYDMTGDKPTLEGV